MIITYIIKLHKTKILHFFTNLIIFLVAVETPLFFVRLYTRYIYLYETMDNYHGNKNIQTQKYHILENNDAQV